MTLDFGGGSQSGRAVGAYIVVAYRIFVSSWSNPVASCLVLVKSNILFEKLCEFCKTRQDYISRQRENIS